MAYKRLMEEFHLKQDAIAERVSKSRTAVTNSMRLLKLDDRVQQMLIDEMISTGHARALLALESKDAQAEAAVKVFDEKLSVRETERLVKELLNPVQKKKRNPKIRQKNWFIRIWKRKLNRLSVQRLQLTEGQIIRERLKLNTILKKNWNVLLNYWKQ